MLNDLHGSGDHLAGQTVLLVDDDGRNIFALSSVLEYRGLRVLTATMGNEAIRILHNASNVAIVLMDIMMPEMDGYETHAEDRERCLEAGASAFLAKPVNTGQRLAALAHVAASVRQARNAHDQPAREYPAGR